MAAVARLAANPDDLKTLDAYCHAGYARRAAALLHLHRSSVARRLGQLGKALGTDLTQPTGLLRATLALTTWQLLNDRSRQRHQASETTGQTEPRPPPASSQ